MPQIIEVPGQGRVEFPDGMSDADIVKAIRGSKPADSAADGVGALESGLIAAGRGTDKIVQGVKQLYLKAKTGLTDDVAAQRELDRMAAEQADNDRLYKPLQEAHPVATAIGEATPMMAVPVGGAGAGLLAMAGRSAVAGAVPGLLSYGDASDRLKAGALGAAGGALGGAVGAGIGKVLNPAGAAAARGLSADAAAAADRLGLKLTPGQVTQNPAMLSFENYLAKSPGSSGAMQAKAAANATALDTAGAKAMGQSADNLGEGTFATAKNAIGQEFDRLQGITAPQLGTDFMNSLVQIDAANAARGSFRSKPVDSLIDKSLDLAAKGNLTGTAYKEIRTQISNEAQGAFRAGDATLGQALKTVRGALDDAAKKSLGQADQEAWDTVRSQWQAYKLLSKSNVSEAGNVSAPRLAAAVRAQGDGLRTGAAQGPIADIARVGEAIKGVANPNSGQLAQMGNYGGITGLALAAGNKAAGAAYNSPLIQKYLAEGVLEIGPTGQLILGKLATPIAAQQVSGFLGAR